MTEDDAVTAGLSARYGLSDGASGSVTESHEQARRGRPVDSDVPLAESAAEYSQREDRLFNDNSHHQPTDPQYVRHREKPEHRLMIVLKAKGYSTREIAEMTGYTSICVGHVLRQPWARAQLLEEIRKQGGDELETILKGAAIDCVYTLIEQRDTSPAGNVRVAAANSILDRYLGKPVQKTDLTVTKGPNAADVEEAQRELDRLKAEELRLRAN